MDTTINPCQDFYHYACGGWLNDTESTETNLLHVIRPKIIARIRNVLEEPVKEDEPRVLKVTKNFYNICMDEDLLESNNLQEINRIVDEAAGGWPVVKGNNWPGWNFDWIRTYYKFSQYGVYPSTLFNFHVGVDADPFHPAGGKRKIIKVKVPRYDYKKENLLQKSINEPEAQDYLRYMVDVAMMMGASNRRNVETELLEVLKLEAKLFNVIKLLWLLFLLLLL